MAINRDYASCVEINKVIGRILDEALNTEPAVVSTSEDVVATKLYDLANVDDLDFSNLNGLEEIPMQSEDFLKWLDSFDWQTSLPAY